jgi:hypothetical protein
MTETPATSDPAPLRTLPAAVRAQVLGWAAETVGGLPPAQIPPGLTRVARFTPSKRAKLGAAVLAQAVESDAAFRAAVAEKASRETAELAGDSSRNGEPAPMTNSDSVSAAAAAYLLRLPTEEELLATVRDTTPDATRAELDQQRGETRRLHKELKRVTAERDDARAQLESTGPVGEEIEKLRRRLREQGTRLRRAEQDAQIRDTQLSEELQGLRRQVAGLTEEAAGWQERARNAAERADRAQEALGRLREQAGLHKATADRRLDLLLSTVEGAVSGLRREWELASGGSDPADVVAGRLPGSVPVAESTADPARLSAWLRLPSAHLIVDGYNVSKTGFGELTLAQQRERLVRLLSALSARTSAEVTVVFDGAAVAVPAPPGRGIRVLFSPPGVIADDVIRSLAAAEPPGRVVVVVSSDREVAEGVRRSGARTAGSGVLLALLG